METLHYLTDNQLESIAAELEENRNLLLNIVKATCSCGFNYRIKLGYHADSCEYRNIAEGDDE